MAVAATLASAPSPSGAVVPGTNGKIAFESNRDGDPDIFVMNGDGTVETNITKHPALDFYPVWSPDSTQIAWGSDRAEPGNVDVWVMDADGSNPTRLTTTPGEDRGASWTSDGAKIVFHSARNAAPASHTFDLFVMDADGQNQTMLVSNASAGYACGDSTTGKVVYNSNADGDFDIYTYSFATGAITNVTNNTIFDSGPKFSPDCNSISFNRFDDGGSLDVWRIGTDGSNAVNLTNAPGFFDAFSAWSPDGQRILFTSNRDVNFEIYAMDSSDGSNVVRYTHTKKGQNDFRGDWGTAPNTYGPPTDKDQCRKGRWAEFTTPAFADQSQCVSYVSSGSIGG